MQYGTVTGRYLSGAGRPADGKVLFTPEVTAILVSGVDPATVLPAAVVGVLDTEGYLAERYNVDEDGKLLPGRERGVQLLIPDGTTNPVSWTWRVSPALKAGAQHLPSDPFSIDVTASGGDLAVLAPVPSSTGEAIVRGASAYEVWKAQPGNTGTEADFLASIGGADLTGYATETYVDQAVTNVTPSDSAVMDAVVKAQGAQYVYSATEPTATTYTAADGSTWPVVWVSTTTVDGGTSTSVTATAPTFDDGTDTYTITATTGVDYYVGGALTSAGTYSVTAPATVTITAQAQPGYTLTGTTSWSFDFTVSADTTPPTAGTLAVTTTSTTADLTVTGASDAGGLHATPYSYSRDGGTTWTAWQAGATYQYTGLTASTSYTFRHRVQDAAGNISTGTTVTQSTTAAAQLSNVFLDTFTGANSDLTGHLADTGQSWAGSTASTFIESNKLKTSTAVVYSTHGSGAPAEGTATVTLPTSGAAVQMSFRAPASTSLSGTVITLTAEGLASFGGSTVMPTMTFNNNGTLNTYTAIPGFTSGGTYAVRLAWSGSTVTVYVDGTRLLEGTYTSAQLTTLSGYTSVQVVGGTTARIDDLRVAA